MQSEPVQRTVAIKLLKRGMDSDAVLKRFDLERQSLAAMNHSGIAQVFDAGISETGQHYFVMEFVDGSSLTDYANAHQLSSRDRLELFAQVCDAVTHAHQKGILHRDIKPSNVLVTEVEGRPQIKIIDFGIAKAIEGSTQHGTQITREPIMMGTPQYMSPEQAAGSASVDTRTDVYAMGVLLYELLTGRLPFEPNSLQRAAMDEMFRIIREEDPPKPSTKLSSISEPDQAAIARQRSTEPRSLIRMLRQELEWIPLKAMRKDPEHRYAGASEMGEDIRNYLSGNALTAGPESRVYRMKKLAKRYRWPLAAGLAVAASMIVGVIGTSVMAVRAARQQQLAEERFQDVRSLANTFIFEIYESIRNLAGSTPAVEQLVATALNYLQKLEASGEIAPNDELWLEIGNAYVKLGDVQGNPADNNLGDWRAANKSFARARDIFQTWLTREPNNRSATIGLGDAISGLAEVCQYEGKADQADEYLRESLEICLAEFASWPDAKSSHRVHRIQFLIAAAIFNRGDHKAAKERFQETVDFLEARLKNTSSIQLESDLAMSLGRLGQLQVEFHETTAAEGTLKRSVELLEQISAAEPDNAYHKRNLAIGYDHLARFHMANEETTEAIQLFEQSIAMFRELAESDPDNPRMKRDVIFSMTRFGNLLMSMGRFEDARSTFDHLAELAEKNYRAFPIFENGNQWVQTVESISRLLIAEEDFEEASAIQRRVVKLREELWSSNPDNAMIKQKVAFARRKLGQSLLKLSRYEEALEEFDVATTLNREQYEAAPEADGNPRRLASSLMFAGRALLMLERETEAMKRFDEAIKVRQLESSGKPNDVDAALGLALLLAEIGTSLEELDSSDANARSRLLFDQAIQLFRAHENDLSDRESEVYQRLVK